MKQFKLKSKVLFITFFMLVHKGVFSQTSITLQAAIDTALSRNLNLQAAKLRTMAAGKMEASALDLSATATTLEYGSINSAYGDSRLGIAQAFSFPVVYQRQKELLEAHTKHFKLSEDEIRLQVRKEITSLYYQMLLMDEKKSLLLQADTLFQAALKKQEQRFDAGDINILEKTTAETQRMQIANQLQQLDADRATLQVKFSSLIHTGQVYSPLKSNAKAQLVSLPGASVVFSHPALRVKMQQQQIALRDIAVQKTKLLPQVSLGYVNQSIRGWQIVNGVEKYYTAANRFSSVLVGVNIPVFTKAQKAKIASGKYNLEAQQAEYNEALRQQTVILEQLLLQYHNNEKQLNYYEQYALKQAKVLREHSTLQLNNGAISYLEWMLLIHQSIQLETEYFTALNGWNMTVIELNAYINN